MNIKKYKNLWRENDVMRHVSKAVAIAMCFVLVTTSADITALAYPEDAESTESVEVKNAEESKGEENNANIETGGEDNQKLDESEKKVLSDDSTEESNQSDNIQNENIESQLDDTQNENAESQSDDTPDENAESQPDDEQVAFEKSVTVDGVVITVEADAGVFPEGATIEVRKATAIEEKEAAKAVDEVRDEEKNVAVAYTFDITIYDKYGNEIEPKKENGSVKVTFKMAEIANENLETDVYHLAETSNRLNAENLDVNTEEGEADEAAVNAPSFSLYTVEFTYKGHQYVLEGDEKVELTTILDAVGIEKNGEISKVEGSNDELFKPVFEGDTCYIKAVRAFSSEEWLRVTIDGIEYKIVVTDSQTVSSWTDLQTALNGTDEVITLGADINATTGDSTLVVSGTKILDLNGFTINGKIGSSNSVGSVLKVPADTKLTLEDKSDSKAGTITGGDAAFGGGVDVSTGDGKPRAAGGTFIMNGGTITGNRGGEYDGGGGVYVNGGVFSMRGNSVISGNSGNWGGGVYVDNAEFVMLDNSKIANNNASKFGGGLYSDGIDANVYINSGNVDNNTSYQGGGVFIANGTFNMHGGTICNNAATSAIANNGGGLVAGVNITLGGTAKITGNTVHGASNNVFLYANKTITIDTPESSMNIGLSMLKPGVFTSDPAEGYLGYFISDDSNYKVAYTTDKKLMLAKKYNVTIDSTITNGTVTTDVTDDKAFVGDTVTVTATADSGYILKTLKYNDGTDHDITNTKSFIMPEADVTITAEFIVKPASIVTTAPTAKSLTYNGTDQVLVSQGSASGGTMNYAVGSSSTTAPVSGWSTSIPNGKNAGTYYVWYKSVGDSDHSDSVPVCVIVVIDKKSEPTPTPTPTPTPEPITKPDSKHTSKSHSQPELQPIIPVAPSLQYAETGKPITNYVVNNPTESNVPLPFMTVDSSKAGWKLIDESLDEYKAKYKKNVGTFSVTMNGSTMVDTKLITDAHEKKIPLSFVLDDEVVIGIPVVNSVLSNQAKKGKTTYFNVSAMTTAEAVEIKKAHAGLLPSDIVSIGGNENTPVVLTLCSNDKLSTKKSQLMTITFNAKKAGFKQGDRVYLYCGTSQIGIAMYKIGKVDMNGLVTFHVPMVSNYWTIGSKNVKNLLHE